MKAAIITNSTDQSRAMYFVSMLTLSTKYSIEATVFPESQDCGQPDLIILDQFYDKPIQIPATVKTNRIIVIGSEPRKSQAYLHNDSIYFNLSEESEKREFQSTYLLAATPNFPWAYKYTGYFNLFEKLYEECLWMKEEDRDALGNQTLSLVETMQNPALSKTEKAMKLNDFFQQTSQIIRDKKSPLWLTVLKIAAIIVVTAAVTAFVAACICTAGPWVGVTGFLAAFLAGNQLAIIFASISSFVGVAVGTYTAYSLFNNKAIQTSLNNIASEMIALLPKDAPEIPNQVGNNLESA